MGQPQHARKQQLAIGGKQNSMLNRARKRTLDVLNNALQRPKIKPWSVAIVIASLIAIYVLIPQIKALHGTLQTLSTANVFWVLAGVLMTVLVFVASGYAQYASGKNIGSYKRLTILQLTGAFIDHFLPFNAGSVSLTARYYTRLRKTKMQALAISLTPTIIGIAITLVLIALISPVTLSHLFHHAVDSKTFLWIVAVAIVLFALAYLLFVPFRTRIWHFITHMVDGMASITLWPQLVQVIAGCLVLRLAGSVALAFSVYAVHASMALIDTFTIFITAQIIASLSPTPGGLGTTEAFLVVALTTAGLSLPEAAAATLIFRFVTFWLPIVPGMLAVHAVYGWE